MYPKAWLKYKHCVITFPITHPKDGSLSHSKYKDVTFHSRYLVFSMLKNTLNGLALCKIHFLSIPKVTMICRLKVLG